MKEFAEIFVNNKIYTYAVPATLQDVLKIGQEVLVPLRKKNIPGYVVRFVAKPKFVTRAVLELLDPKEYFDEQLVKLAVWMADYYKCYPETALKAILPR